MVVAVERPRKASLIIRPDGDVLAFFRGTGAGYQTRINAALRAYVKAEGCGADCTKFPAPRGAE